VNRLIKKYRRHCLSGFLGVETWCSTWDILFLFGRAVTSIDFRLYHIGDIIGCGNGRSV
jgi:hypothetical protein